MGSVSVSVFLGFFIAFVVLGDARHTRHTSDGQELDNFRQFRHYVFIVVAGTGRRCGGSILNNRWVLTSAFCLKDGLELDLHFRQNLDDDSEFISVSVNRDQVFVYPTNYDDIALVKIPITLHFTEALAPMNVSKLSLEALRGRFTVMPALSNFILEEGATSTTDGSMTSSDSTESTETSQTTTPGSTSTQNITQETTVCIVCQLPTPRISGITPEDEQEQPDQLKYGMYNVLEHTICKQVYGGTFDEYTQLCIESWGDNPNRPCDSDYGSGLIVGWPAKGELVGLFHMYSPLCENRQPSVFTFIGKYLPWIDSMISGSS